MLILFSIILYADSKKGDIVIVVYGLNNNNGQVGLALFRGPKGFPADENKAVKKSVAKVNQKKASFTLKNIPYGKYAIAVFHDENSNYKLDTTFIGLPSEGVGTSNNVKASLGPPKYKNAEFFHKKEKTPLLIKMFYL